MNINLELYKTFYSVAKNKNITKASKELNISQPAISKAIKNLETQIGCTLFIRSKNGVTLTNEGKTFYDEIEKAFEIVGNAEDKILKSMNLEYGTLRIGVNKTIMENFLLPFIETFHKKYPNIKIKLFTGPTSELITKAKSGIIDIIIMNLPYAIPKEFVTESLVKIHDCFIANDNFKELKGKTIPLEELNNYPLILIANGSSTRYFLDNFCIKNDIYLKPEFEITSNSLIKEFTKIGLGIGFTTREYINELLDNKTLFEIKTNPKIPTRNIGIVYLKSNTLSKVTNAFIKILNNHK